MSTERGSCNIGYGKPMNEIDTIRERIASVQNYELNQHVAEFDGIHAELERALASIDGL